MAVYLGNNKLTFDGISEIYVGSNKVYSAGPIDYSTEYFFVENLTNSNNTLKLYPFQTTSASTSTYAPEITVYYSLDKNTWQSGVVGGSSSRSITYTIPANSKVYLKATTTAWGYYSSSSNNGSNRIYCSDGNFSVGGNIMSLLYGDNFIGQTTISAQYCFASLLNSGASRLIDIDRVVLPATTLTKDCYFRMFQGCTSLTTVPSNLLPATTLAESCYYQMFSGCTGLTSIPPNLLPATTLEHYCYYGMFYNCTSLTTPPQLPGTTLQGYSNYQQMFYGCTSLTTAPQLPATTLVQSCYSQMFYGCTSLTAAPELPATTLANSCYTNMFRNCTSLTTPPELPATTLAQTCYSSMFYGCTSLTTAPELPATTLEQSCYSYMFKGCTSLTTVPSDLLPSTTLQTSCYREMFSGCTSLTTAPELPATTSQSTCYYQMFYNCSSLNEITCSANDISASNCTFQWVSGVAASGTFHKKGDAAWTTGVDGIPTGWTVIDDRPYNPIDDYFWVENTSNASKQVCFNLIEVYKSSSWSSLQEIYGSGTLYYSTNKTTWSTISTNTYARIIYLTVPANTRYYLYMSWSTYGSTYSSFNLTSGGTANIYGWGAYIVWGNYSGTGRCSSVFKPVNSSDNNVFVIGGNIRTITGSGQSGVSSTTQTYYDRSSYYKASSYTNVRYWTGLGKSTDSVISNRSQSGLYFQYIKDASQLYIGSTDVRPDFLNSGPNFVGPIYT